jgi:hydroxymethylglutaryl-CoA lyase
MTATAQRVTLVDVTTRDGLQDEPFVVATARKAEIVSALAAAGIAEIEATSFVHPAWVPQMRDAEALIPLLPRTIRSSALILNERGFERALTAYTAAGSAPGSYDLVYVASASPRHNASNNNRTIAQTLASFDTIAARARAAGVSLRGAISCSFVSPWTDETIELDTVLEIAARFEAGGCATVGLADTIGRATPELVARTVTAVQQASKVPLSLHFHDLRGSALRNVEAGLSCGVRRFEGVLAGLGGCPFAPDAPGNLDLEALAAYVESRGFATGTDAAKLAAARAVLQRALDDAEPLPAAHAAAT